MKQAFIFMPYNPGDVVMALRFSQALHLANPDLVLDFITSDECLPLTQNLPWLRHRIGLPRRQCKESLLAGAEVGPAIELLKEVLQPISKHAYDLGVNLFQGDWGAYLMPLFKTKQCMGLWPEYGAGLKCHGQWMERWMAQPVERQAIPFHCMDLWRKQTEALGWGRLHSPLPQGLWSLPLGQRPIQPKQNRIALHPGTAWLGKQWPIPFWVELAKDLLDQGSEIWLTGAPEEKSLGLAFDRALSADAKPRLHDVIGQTKWPDMISLYDQMNWVVTGDTVAMHIAAGTSCQVLSLFGASNPRETGPYGVGHFIFETESTPYPTQLEFSKPHAGLGALQASDVSSFLLAGYAPETARLWETQWHSTLQAQTLVGRNGRQPDAPEMRFWVELPSKTMPPIALPPLLTQLETCLQAAILSPNAETLRELDACEAQWASATDQNAIWEAYRIGIHGISLLHLPQHLAQRSVRLHQAVDEWMHFSAHLIAEQAPQKTQ
jgi:ADP-heptose:LPS heptosyltransferase